MVPATAPNLQDFDTILKMAQVPIFAIRIDRTITRFSPAFGFYLSHSDIPHHTAKERTCTTRAVLPNTYKKNSTAQNQFAQLVDTLVTARYPSVGATFLTVASIRDGDDSQELHDDGHGEHGQDDGGDDANGHDGDDDDDDDGDCGDDRLSWRCSPLFLCLLSMPRFSCDAEE